MRIDLGALLRGHLLRGEECSRDGVGEVPVSVVQSCLDEAKVRLHSRGVHHRGDRQHDRGRQDAVDGTGDDLGDGDEPDGAGRLHPVLDLAGEAKLPRHVEGNRLHVLESHRAADDPGHKDGREGRLLFRALASDALASDALADLRRDLQEDEKQQERLDQRPEHELPQVLAQHDEIP